MKDPSALKMERKKGTMTRQKENMEENEKIDHLKEEKSDIGKHLTRSTCALVCVHILSRVPISNLNLFDFFSKRSLQNLTECQDFQLEIVI